MNLNRLKRRIGIVTGVWKSLRQIDVAQDETDRAREQLVDAVEAENRAAARASSAQRVLSEKVEIVMAVEADLARKNPLSGALEFTS